MNNFQDVLDLVSFGIPTYENCEEEDFTGGDTQIALWVTSTSECDRSLFQPEDAFLSV